MCVFCQQPDCLESEYCGLHPMRGPLAVYYRDLIGHWSEYRAMSASINQPIYMPSELLSFKSSWRQAPICFRGHTVIGKTPRCTEADMVREVRTVLTEGFSPRVSLSATKRHALRLSKRGPFPWPPSCVSVTTRFETATFFPYMRKEEGRTEQFTAVYVIIPDHLWDIRRLQLDLLSERKIEPLPAIALEHAMNSIKPTQIAGAVICRSRNINGTTSGTGDFFRVLSVPCRTMISPHLVDYFGEDAKRAITFLHAYATCTQISSPHFTTTDIDDFAAGISSATNELECVFERSRKTIQEKEKSAWEKLARSFST